MNVVVKVSVTMNLEFAVASMDLLAKIVVKKKRSLIYIYDLPPDFNSLLLEGRHLELECVNRIYDNRNATIWTDFLYGSQRKTRKRRRNKSPPSSSKRKALTDKTYSEAENAKPCSFTALANGFPKTENLSLTWCSNVSSLGLCSLAQKCNSLISWDLQGKQTYEELLFLLPWLQVLST